MTGALDRLGQLHPKRFNWKSDPDTLWDGFLAHEVEDIVPGAVTGTKDDRQSIFKVVAAADGTKITKNIDKEDWEIGKIEELYTVDDETAGTIPEDKEVGDVKTPAQYASDTIWEAEREVDWYQEMDHSKLVPLLTASIQELVTRVETLEAA